MWSVTSSNLTHISKQRACWKSLLVIPESPSEKQAHTTSQLTVPQQASR